MHGFTKDTIETLKRPTAERLTEKAGNNLMTRSSNSDQSTIMSKSKIQHDINRSTNNVAEN